MERKTSTRAGCLTGLALRVAQLRDRFPDALVSTDLLDGSSGPDLICWDADPEEIWVWLFESDDAEGAARERLRGFLADPRVVTGVVARRVVAGPNAVFPTVSIEAAEPFDDRHRVEVRHGAGDGIQLCREFGVEERTPRAERMAVLDAVEAAADADHESRESLGYRRAGDPPSEFVRAPAQVGGGTWRRPVTVHLQLTVDLSGDLALQTVRAWFESAWSLFRQLLAPGAEPSGTVRMDVVDPDDEEGSWQRPFSAEHWAEFLAGLGRGRAELHRLTVELPAGVRYAWLAAAERSLGVDLWRYPVDGREVGVLGIEVPRTLFDSAAEPYVALLRDAADAGALFGLVGIDYGVQLTTGLEYALHLHPWEGVRRVRETLRGYSWITILSEPQAGRVGGAARLRASGAFVEVEHLRGGGWWLRATDTFDAYQDAEAERVHQVLRPLLPDGTHPSTFKDEWRDV